jgi:choline dehydrogenase-like flavoprotein
MIRDLDAPTFQMPEGRFDVAIAGAGVAGITLAVALAAQGRRVLLLEAGGLEATQDSQTLYEGRSTGQTYAALTFARLRFLGGTSNHWGGWCRPLDRGDLEPRPWIPHSGWPIAKSELDRFLPAARSVLELKPVRPDRPVRELAGPFNEIAFHFDPPVRFREKYLPTLTANPRIDLMLNANVVDIETDGDSGRITGFLARGYQPDAPLRRVAADTYVLALGGIETPRALLLGDRVRARAIGNDRDLVGRYFMEHPTYDLGHFAVRRGRFPGRAGVVLGSRYWRFLSPAPATQARLRTANAALRLVYSGQVGDGTLRGPVPDAMADRTPPCTDVVLRDLARVTASKACPERYDAAGLLAVAFEQVPNPLSRVMLDTETDRFGLPRTRLDWRFTAQDEQGVRRLAGHLAEAFARADLGRVKLFDWVLADDAPLPDRHSGFGPGLACHHMGTTRMAETASKGVVDPDLRVFGTPNLYVASSSVFPTAGHANPTLTIVQLTLRLAEHLAKASATQGRAAETLERPPTP